MACARKSSSGIAVVSWAAVKQDNTGKTLTDLAGYKIHYGRSKQAMRSVVVVKDPNQTAYVLKGLPPATWYFAVSAYTTSGEESALSPVVAQTIK